MQGKRGKRKRGCLQESEENGGTGEMEGEWGVSCRSKTRGGDGARDAEGEMQQGGGDVERRSALGVPGQWDVCKTARTRGSSEGMDGHNGELGTPRPWRGWDGEMSGIRVCRDCRGSGDGQKFRGALGETGVWD